MNIEEIDIKDIEFGEPIEEKEPNYRDGYIRGIYRARNIIDNQQREIERLNNIINKAIEYLKENACIDEDVEYFCDDLRYDECKKLLDILKGSDKE